MNLWFEVQTKLNGRVSRKVANNTYLQTREENTYAVKLHATDVVTFHKDKIVLNSGGWHTLTTRDRINNWIGSSGWRVCQDKGVWYVVNGEVTAPYADGFTLVYFERNGTDGYQVMQATVGQDSKKTIKLRKQVND